MTLLARLKAATGPDREIDVLIALDQRIVGGFDPTPFKADALGYEQDGEAGFIRVYLKASPETWLWRGAAPDYTGSIDAALSWMPEGWKLRKLAEPESEGASYGGLCELICIGPEWETIPIQQMNPTSLAPTLSLAICIAICKARGIENA